MNKQTQFSIIDIVGSIYEIANDPDAADVALGEMARVLNSDKALLVRLASDRRRDIALGHFGVDREYINRALREREDPESFLSRESHWQSGLVTCDRDCTRPASRQRKANVGRLLIHPDATEHTIVGVIESNDMHHIMLWFHRNRKIGRFERADRDFFQALMPHWQRAMHQKLMYDFRDSALHAAGVVMDQSPFGLYIIGRDGRVLYRNAAARAQCKASAGISVRNQALVFGKREIRSAYEQMLAAIRHGGKDDDPRLQPVSFEKIKGGGTYQLGMRRLHLANRRGSLATRNVVGLYVYDTGDKMALSVNSLKSLYHLTDAEARVCDLLYQSRNLPEAANILGISINTAKTHLNRSFRKVGVQSQAELVRRLNSQLYVG